MSFFFLNGNGNGYNTKNLHKAELIWEKSGFFTSRDSFEADINLRDQHARFHLLSTAFSERSRESPCW